MVTLVVMVPALPLPLELDIGREGDRVAIGRLCYRVGELGLVCDIEIRRQRRRRHHAEPQSQQQPRQRAAKAAGQKRLAEKRGRIHIEMAAAVDERGASAPSIEFRSMDYGFSSPGRRQPRYSQADPRRALTARCDASSIQLESIIVDAGATGFSALRAD
ncbi:hypothetical protein ACFSKM_08185 [Ancylobacter dichloromethanicus]